jgi:hypothetical protein
VADATPVQEPVLLAVSFDFAVIVDESFGSHRKRLG